MRVSDVENTTLNFNENLLLNVIDFSSDPDVDPSDDQGLTFSWYCKQQDEVN